MNWKNKMKEKGKEKQWVDMDMPGADRQVSLSRPTATMEVNVPSPPVLPPFPTLSSRLAHSSSTLLLPKIERNEHLTRASSLSALDNQSALSSSLGTLNGSSGSGLHRRDSRAAVLELTAQRAASEEIQNLRNKVMNLKKEVASHKSEKQKMQGEISSLKSRVSYLGATARGLRKAVDSNNESAIRAETAAVKQSSISQNLSDKYKKVKHALELLQDSGVLAQSGSLASPSTSAPESRHSVLSKMPRDGNRTAERAYRTALNLLIREKARTEREFKATQIEAARLRKQNSEVQQRLHHAQSELRRFRSLYNAQMSKDNDEGKGKGARQARLGQGEDHADDDAGSKVEAGGNIQEQQPFSMRLTRVLDAEQPILQTVKSACDDHDAEEAARIAARFRGILHLASDMDNCITFEQVATAVISHLPNLMDCESAFLIFPDELTQSMWTIVSRSGVRANLGQMAGTLAGKVMLEREIINILDVDKDGRYNKAREFDSILDVVARCTIAIPILPEQAHVKMTDQMRVISTKSLGNCDLKVSAVLVCYNKKLRPDSGIAKSDTKARAMAAAFDPVDEAMGRLIADYISSAIENSMSRLYYTRAIHFLSKLSQCAHNLHRLTLPPSDHPNYDTKHLAQAIEEIVTEILSAKCVRLFIVEERSGVPLLAPPGSEMARRHLEARMEQGGRYKAFASSALAFSDNLGGNDTAEQGIEGSPHTRQDFIDEEGMGSHDEQDTIAPLGQHTKSRQRRRRGGRGGRGMRGSDLNKNPHLRVTDELWHVEVEEDTEEGLSTLRQLWHKPTCGIAGYILRHPIPTFVSHAYNNPLFNGLADAALKDMDMICCPILNSHDVPIGVLQISVEGERQVRELAALHVSWRTSTSSQGHERGYEVTKTIGMDGKDPFEERMKGRRATKRRMSKVVRDHQHHDNAVKAVVSVCHQIGLVLEHVRAVGKMFNSKIKEDEKVLSALFKRWLHSRKEQARWERENMSPEERRERDRILKDLRTAAAGKIQHTARKFLARVERRRRAAATEIQRHARGMIQRENLQEQSRLEDLEQEALWAAAENPNF
eukprot:g5201.t1